MFGLSVATRIYIALDAVDMRRGFNGLFGLVKDHLGEDPLSGHVFLFSNRARTRVKALVWDGSGLWICTKRLERGCFHWPEAPEETDNVKSVVLRPEELSMLLNGLDLKTVKRRGNWYRNPSAA
jgi:transposase